MSQPLQARRLTLYITNSGLLVQSIQHKLVIVGHVVWQSLCLLCSLLEILLRVHLLGQDQSTRLSRVADQYRDGRSDLA